MKSNVKTKHAIEMLLDSFVQQQRYLPPGARPIFFVEDLPTRLKAHAQRTAPFGGWRAWTHEGRLRFVVATLTGQPRAQSGLLCLEVNFFDADGVNVAAGEWALKENGDWVLIRVLDAPLRSPARRCRVVRGLARNLARLLTRDRP